MTGIGNRRATYATLCLIILALAGIHPARAQTKDFNVPAQSATTGIPEFARQAGIQILVAEKLVRGKRTSEVKGSLSIEQALRVLLQGTLLTATSKGGATYTVVSAQSPTTLNAIGPVSIDGDRKSPSSDSNGLTEIVVTAQKKSERLQDVPVPVTVLDAETLAERGQNRLVDYFATVPGLNYSAAPYGGGQQTISIRGITTGAATNPTVGVTIDDVPFGSSTFLGSGGLLFPDLDPSDLARIEVLRGPQGTLYGASSLGGLIKYVTKDPSTDAVSGRVEVLGDAAEHGDAGYGARGALNVPISDTLAVRVSGFVRHDPGYIDNVTTGQDNVNRANVNGGRIAALWSASDTVSLKLSAIFQNYGANGISAVDTNEFLQPTLGDFKQARVLGTEQYSSRAVLYTATLNAKLGSLDFTSISGFGTNNYFQVGDQTSGYYGYLAGVLCTGSIFCGVSPPGAFIEHNFGTAKFTQEIRLSSPSDQMFEWLAGGFYTHESSPSDEFYGAINPTDGRPVGVIEDFNFPSSLSEYALFGDLTYHVSERFDVQFGGRESIHRQVYNETDSGPETASFYNGAASPFVNPTERIKENAFTYLVAPELKISPELMVYARFTSGYRLGGANTNAVVENVPVQYAPDKTNNYELGIKGDLLDHVLTFDASAYYIDWKKIQIYLLTSTFSSYFANAGDAKSEGLEFSLHARPYAGLTIGATTSLNEAELTQNIPAASLAFGVAGDRLPYTSRFSGSLSADQDFLEFGDLRGYAGGTLSYVGARVGEFAGCTYSAATLCTGASGPRLEFPGYAQTNLHVGMRNQSWTVNLFVNNVADRRGAVGGGPVGAGYEVFYIQPRTVGVSVAKSF